MTTRAAKDKKQKVYNWDTKIIQALRRVWRNCPGRIAAFNAAKDPQTPKHVICAECRTSFHQKLAIVDHIDPVVPIEGRSSWDEYIERLRSENLQVLCEQCSRVKTKSENDKRREYKKSLKEQKPKKRRTT